MLVSKMYKYVTRHKEPITLASGEKSYFYINMKDCFHDPTYLSSLIREIQRTLTSSIGYDRIVGIETGSMHLAAIFGWDHNIPWLTVRKEVKTYGLRKIVEGLYEPRMTCLLFEDVITTGRTVSKAIASLHKVGLVVDQVLSIVDRRKEVTPEINSVPYKTLFRFEANEEMKTCNFERA